MNKNKILTFLVGILLLTNIALVAFFVARKHTPEKQRGRGGDRSAVMREFLKDSVGFNEQQLAQYDKLRQQNRETLRPLFEDLGNAKLQFYRFVSQPGPDSARLAAASLIGEKQKALDMAFFNHFEEIRALCTPAQQPGFDKVMQQIIRRMTAPPRRGEHKQKMGQKEKK
jgi:periplasmic protein CpxP/Spy